MNFEDKKYRADLVKEFKAKLEELKQEQKQKDENEKENKGEKE
jgi:hypothetical protein